MDKETREAFKTIGDKLEKGADTMVDLGKSVVKIFERLKHVVTPEECHKRQVELIEAVRANGKTKYTTKQLIAGIGAIALAAIPCVTGLVVIVRQVMALLNGVGG